MILKRITVKRLKAIRQDKTIDFSPELNIIKGSDNEAGKSSLRVAITKALFQDPTTSQKEVLGLTSWGTDEPWEVALEFDSGSESYRISKSLKDGSCELTRSGSGERSVTNKKAIAASIARITGCPTETFFESTACIGQDELIRLIPPGTTKSEEKKVFGTITQRLQATISGSEETDVKAIIDRLYDKTHRKNANGPYARIQQIADKIAGLQRGKPEQEEKIDRVMENRRELDRVKKELAKISGELPVKQQLAEKNVKILGLQEDIKRDKTQYGNFKRAKELKAKLDDMEEKSGEFSCFAGAEERMEQLADAEMEREDLRKQKAGLQDELRALAKRKPPFWILISGGALLAGGLAGAFANKHLGIVADAGGLLLALWLILQMVWRRQDKLIRERTTQIEEADQEKGKTIKELLESFGFSDYVEYHRRLKEYVEGKEKARELRNKLSGILGDKEWREFEEENEDLDMRATANGKELQQLLPFKKEPHELQKLQNEVSTLQGNKESLKREESAIERFFEFTDVDTDQLASIEEQLEWLEKERAFWERKQRVFDITREALEEARKQTLSKAALAMESGLGGYISAITNGKYSRVKISDVDLSIETSPPEKEGWVNVLELSKATQDQFYICARFALVKLVTEGKAPPLLLDDPFVNFHPKRLARMISLLQELAKENQILLFTASDAYDGCGNIISIG
ncbi:MAG: AAA family ATPase [Dehalococcoidia bacterium]|nr:AAA family ATPase [Dehalococcoidia bacterium]